MKRESKNGEGVSLSQYRGPVVANFEGHGRTLSLENDSRF